MREETRPTKSNLPARFTEGIADSTSSCILFWLSSLKRCSLYRRLWKNAYIFIHYFVDNVKIGLTVELYYECLCLILYWIKISQKAYIKIFVLFIVLILYLLFIIICLVTIVFFVIFTIFVVICLFLSYLLNKVVNSCIWIILRLLLILRRNYRLLLWFLLFWILASKATFILSKNFFYHVNVWFKLSFILLIHFHLNSHLLLIFCLLSTIDSF